MPRKSDYTTGAASDGRMRDCEYLAEAIAAIFADDGGIGPNVLPRAAVLLEKRSGKRSRPSSFARTATVAVSSRLAFVFPFRF